MPELPEVETVRKGLEKLVVGKTIQEVIVFWPRIIESPEVDVFQGQLAGQTIEGIERRGKFLIFKLSDNDMISHLRMEGKYEFHQADDEIAKHTHVMFTFTDGTQLRYLDVRKFGRMTLVPKNQGHQYKAIKPLLLDQKLVTGLGNIYVDEALWQAQIHPEQPADSLKPAEVATLYQAIIDVLARAVEAGGTTIRTYLNALGEAGTFQVALNVYGQTGLPCNRCGTPIVKTKVAQRGTHYCPQCQQLKGRRLK